MAKASAAIKMYAVFILMALVIAVLRYLTMRSLPVAIPLRLVVMFLENAFYWRSINSPEMTSKKFRFLLFAFIISLLPICMLAYSRDTGFSGRWHCYYFSYLLAMAMFFLLSITIEYRIDF